MLVLTGCFTHGELEAALDRDGDGYQPIVAGGPDCDETRADVNPGVEEACGDGIDNNCDGFIDDSGVGERLWYRDADGDGHGIDDTVRACTEPEGFAPVLGDCADDDPSINPDAEDLCDGIDQDCDGRIDDDADALLQFRDDDGDGFGSDTETLTDCALTPGYVLAPGDCDDTIDSINPAAEDICDGLDQNCNGEIDEDLLFTVQYRDADGDGDGNPDLAVEACENLVGYVPSSGDCDDDDPTRHSNAVDFCDTIDQDCDGAVDEDAHFVLWWHDGDGDGVGDGDSAFTCDPPVGVAFIDGDCNDEVAGIRPGVPDGCDGVDEDCDGAVDEDAAFTVWFADHDDDGLGDLGVQASTCDGAPAGFIGQPGDCDDSDPNVTIPIWYRDHDGDGWGIDDPVAGCDEPAGFTDRLGDCDDTEALRHPGLTEVCNNHRDDDCNPDTDCRTTGTLFLEDAGGFIPVTDGHRYTGTLDLDGDGTWDWYRRDPEQVAWFVGGDTPDFTTPFATRAGCNDPTPTPDFTGDGIHEWFCRNADRTQVEFFSGSDLAGLAIASIGASSPISDVQVVTTGPSPGIWVQLGDTLYFDPSFDGFWVVGAPVSGTVTDARAFVVQEDSLIVHVLSENIGTRLLFELPHADFDEADAVEVLVDGQTYESSDAGSVPVPTSGGVEWAPFVRIISENPYIQHTWHTFDDDFSVSAGWSSATSISTEPGANVWLDLLGDLDADGVLDWGVIDLDPVGQLGRIRFRYGAEDQGASLQGNAGFTLIYNRQDTVGGGALGDLNGDGFADLAVPGPTGLHVFYGTGE